LQVTDVASVWHPVGIVKPAGISKGIVANPALFINSLLPFIFLIIQGAEKSFTPFSAFDSMSFRLLCLLAPDKSVCKSARLLQNIFPVNIGSFISFLVFLAALEVNTVIRNRLNCSGWACAAVVADLKVLLSVWLSQAGIMVFECSSCIKVKEPDIESALSTHFFKVQNG
jgi:hypothetical protein